MGAGEKGRAERGCENRRGIKEGIEEAGRGGKAGKGRREPIIAFFSRQWARSSTLGGVGVQEDTKVGGAYESMAGRSKS